MNIKYQKKFTPPPPPPHFLIKSVLLCFLLILFPRRSRPKPDPNPHVAGAAAQSDRHGPLRPAGVLVAVHVIHGDHLQHDRRLCSEQLGRPN